MSGQLLTHDYDSTVRCTWCPEDAVGPCAHCRRPICGDCCVLMTRAGGTWAVCTRCQAAGHGGVSKGWLTLGLWTLAVLLGLATITEFLRWVFAG